MLWIRYLRCLLADHQWSSSLAINQNARLFSQASYKSVYQALLNEFKPRNKGIFSGDRMKGTGPKHYSSVATCIRSLLPLSSLRIPTIDHSLLSLLSLYYGSLHGDVGLEKLAYSSYVVALALSGVHLHIDIDADVRTLKIGGDAKYYRISTARERSPKRFTALWTTAPANIIRNAKGILWSSLEEWLSLLKMAASQPLYWSRSSPVRHDNKYHDAECMPKYSNTFHQLCFLSGPIASLLVNHWSFALQLSMVLIELQESLLSYIDPGPEHIISRETLSHGLRNERTLADSNAQLILEAEPYLSCCFEGFANFIPLL
ncbi:uncharacterized protein TRIVIDRAFT_60223 [Trichoderma virens Gv29-8]|uniref:Uncharacterized protein n=1 Tax=Hypocrea virens (strain Gv29-8 / FGSC 10586) TaxID=413071 RepID=G9MSA0_HYPVG|nr:uncharacterized protein TRIVIDRAFT_60223 [Trichoderma virens Gv29-8]EHK22959.1 hypothetical protein TRIVIDRAFT_60223 [Trichoderma virens Gv29-8]UKZ48013.1 hypothetical protein TrVGV298_002249 [Trichoderma virens]